MAFDRNVNRVSKGHKFPSKPSKHGSHVNARLGLRLLNRLMPLNRPGQMMLEHQLGYGQACNEPTVKSNKPQNEYV